MIAPEHAEAPAASPDLDSAASGLRRPFELSPSALIVSTLIVVGFLIRLTVARQPLFADELSTYWIVATHSLGGVVSLMYGTTHIPHAEITPPLYFLASWLTSQTSHSPEFVRAPSLIAGTLTIPVIYALGRRTFGRRTGLLAATITTLAPFMIYYSAEARSYAVMMFFVVLSTLSLLIALDTGRTRWWALYAVAECAAFYTHYTCIFVLIVQLLWVLWVRPDARRPALLASVAAVVLFLPWFPGFINDLHSPTTQILSALSPFTVHDVRLSLEHWSIGFPYVVGGGLNAMPGIPALVLLASAGLVSVIGIAAQMRERGVRAIAHGVTDRHVLIFLLLLSVPVGEALQSAVSTHTFGVRNLAASWPALVLVCSALAIGSGRRLRWIAASLAIVAFLIPAVKMLSRRWARPDFRATAQFIEHRAAAGDVVIDYTGVLSPGPLTGLDLVFRPRGPEIRAGAPAERDHPFGLLDKVVTLPQAIGQAVSASHGHRIYLAAFPGGLTTAGGRCCTALERFPAPYHLLETRRFPDFLPLVVQVWGTG